MRKKISIYLALALSTLCLLAVAAAERNDSTNESSQIGGVTVSIWRPTAGAAAPLVIFSHGFHGSSTQSTFLMQALASHGYLVIAPNHADAGRMHGGNGSGPEVNFKEPDAWSSATYADRRDDIKKIVDALKTDPIWQGRIDWSKVAVIGHSLGGYTALGVAGAWSDWKIPEVKAVIALSPYAQPYILKKTLSDLKVPVMYQGGTRDFGITPAIKKSSGAYAQTPHPAYFVNFEGAGHFAWTDLNPNYQDSINYYCIAFLDRYLKGRSEPELDTKRSDVVELSAK